LIVDDESAIRLVCRVNLDTAGFETIEAGDGETALTMAPVNPYGARPC
jgi:DNA-binding response OmpR family regulator